MRKMYLFLDIAVENLSGCIPRWSHGFFSYILTGSLRDIQLGWEMGGKGLEMVLPF